jgi:hypothetical protein
MEDVEVFVPCHQDMTDPATSFSQQLNNSGFEISHCEARKFSFSFPNANQVVAAIAAVNPFLPRIPKEEQVNNLRFLYKKVELLLQCSSQKITAD